MQKKVWQRIGRVFLIVLVFAGAIAIDLSRDTNGISVKNDATSDVAYANGETAHFEGTTFGLLNDGDAATIHLDLPEEPLVSDGVLAFYTYHSITEVWCNGNLLQSYGADIAAKGDMIGNARFLVPLPADAWGNQVTIMLRATENGAYQQVKDLQIYESIEAYQYYIDSDFIGFWCSIPLFFCGIFTLLGLMLNGRFNQTARKGGYIALSAIFTAIWIFCHEGNAGLFGFNGYLWTILEYIAIIIVLLPIMLYAWEVAKEEFSRKLLSITILIDIFYIVVISILNFTNIVHYCVMLPLSHSLIFINGLILLVLAARRGLNGKESDRLFFIGVIIVLLAGLVDLVCFNLSKQYGLLSQVPLPSILSIGVFFFVFYLLRSYLEDISEAQSNSVALKTHSAVMRQMVEEIPSGLCIMEAKAPFPVIEANEMFYRILGYSRKTALAKGYDSICAFFNEKEYRELAEKIKFAQQCEAIYDEDEVTFSFENGTRRTIFFRYYMNHKNERITVNIVDISSRKQMEEELRLSEESYKLALNQSGNVFFSFDVLTRTMRLSPRLAESFNLPMEIGDMPEGFISLGLLEPESVEKYRRFFQCILSGETKGETVISCHLLNAPETPLWYRLSFITVFDEKAVPYSAIITHEDITAQRQMDLVASFHNQMLSSLSENYYATLFFDLNRDRLLRIEGNLIARKIPYDVSFDHLPDNYMEKYVHEDDREALRQFYNREKLFHCFKNDIPVDYIEIRIKLRNKGYEWVKVNAQMKEDPYNGHVIIQILMLDINKSKNDEIQTKQSMEELRREIENSRIKVMISQMQPHFLYNALSAIQVIVKSDPDYAYQLIYDFTVHLRSNIKALSSDTPIPFAEEMKSVKAYLNIEKMRFGDCLQIHYEINCRDFKVIPLTIQPLVENAVRHGVYPRGEQGGIVTIRSFEKDKYYVVEVEDDGVGFYPNKTLNENSNSVGLKNLIFRLKSLMNAEVLIKSEIDQGTVTTIKFPKEIERGEDLA